MDVSCSINDYQIKMERSYYGSHHGKNRCAGEAGVLKSKATRDIKNRVANIYNARTFYNSVKALEKPAESEQGTCLHKRRTLIFVSADEIQHERPERDCKTVPGTRKLHSVLGVKRCVIKTRRLSCFCAACLQSNYDQCLNTQYVDKWRQVVLKRILFINTWGWGYFPAVFINDLKYLPVLVVQCPLLGTGVRGGWGRADCCAICDLFFLFCFLHR